MSHATACVLSYNRPEFLQRCVASLLGHAEAPLELIIHDDGSTDAKVHALLDGWLHNGLVSTVIKNPPGHNQGVGEAIRRSFAVASGDLLLKIDQDLTFKPGWLRRVNEILEENTRRHAEPLIGLLGLFHYHHDPVDSAVCKLAQHDGWQEHTHFCGSAFAIDREVYEQFGMETHSEAFAEDWDLMQRITASEYCCALPDEDLVVNHGFGIGPSTVVVAADQVQSIRKEPLLHG